MKKALIISNITKRFLPGHHSMIDPLKMLGYEVHWAADFSKYEEDISEVPCIIHQIDFIRNPFHPQNIKAYYQLKKLLKKDFEVVHCQSPVGGLLGRIASKRANVTNVLYTAHGLHFYKDSPKKNWLLYYPVERIMLNYTNCLITINTEDYEMAKKMSLNKAKYIQGIGVDTNIGNKEFNYIEKRKSLNLKDDDFVIIAVGEINKNKNHKIIIDAISKIKNSKIKLLLCGLGSLQDELKKIAEDNGIADQVKFLGYRTDVDELYRISNLFVLPSYREGLSRSMMEAMSNGLPCVASRIRGNTDLIHEDLGGFLLNPNDTDGFSESINVIINDGKLARKMGEYNKNIIKNYDIKNIKKEMLYIYREIIEG